MRVSLHLDDFPRSLSNPGRTSCSERVDGALSLGVRMIPEDSKSGSLGVDVSLAPFFTASESCGLKGLLYCLTALQPAPPRASPTRHLLTVAGRVMCLVAQSDPEYSARQHVSSATGVGLGMRYGPSCEIVSTEFHLAHQILVLTSSRSSSRPLSCPCPFFSPG